VRTESVFIEVGTGVSQASDGLGAGSSAAHAALQNIQSFPISVVLVYASVYYNLNQVLAGIQDAVGNALVLGVTTAGEICGGIHRHSVTVVIIASPFLSVRAALGKEVSKDWRQALAQAVENPTFSPYVQEEQFFNSELLSRGKSLFAMIFYPGNTRAASSMGYEILEAFKQASLGRIPVFGGAAADDWRMESNAVFLGNEVHHDSVLIAIFETELEFGISLGHGFLPVGQRMVVTGAEGHELISLDQVPAADVMAHCMGKPRADLEGKHLTLTTGYPIGSPDPMGQYSVNVATYFTPRGGVRMTQPVSVGSEVTLLVDNEDNSVLAGQGAVRKAMIRAGTDSPSLLLVHYCALRPRIMGESRVQVEMGHLLDIAGKAPTAGFFSFGEDAVADDGVSRHNNGVVAVLVFGNKLSAYAMVARENKRFQRQIAAQAEQRLLADVLKQMEDAISVVDAEFRITYVNTAFSRLFGYDSVEVIGRLIGEVFPEGVANVTGENDQGSLASAEESLYRGEIYRSHKDGRLIPVRLTVSTLANDEGEITGYVGAMADLTHYIQLAAEKEASEARYRAAFQTSPDAVNINRLSDGVYMDVNDSFLEITGWSREEVIGQSSRNINIWQNISDRDRLVKQLQTSSICTNFEAQFVKKNGEIIYGSMSASVLTFNGVICILSCTRDITERKQAEEALSITASVFGSTREAIVITDAHNVIIDVNPAFTDITGYTREEALGNNPSMLSSGRQDPQFYAAMWQHLKQDGTWRGEIWNRRKSGEVYAELLSISAISDHTGQVIRYVAVFSDISHIKAHEAALSRVAHYDALTGIPNRVLLADRMKQAIAQTSRDKNMMAVCYLDLDGFKSINDSMGHEAGDQVLIEVANRIGNTLRGGDTVARLGGDEFVALLLGLEKGEECVTTLERLLTAIIQPIQIKNKSYTISASIGVSIYPQDEDDSDTLLRHADQAMYTAKQSGKNRFHIYDTALDRRARDQHDFLKSIRHGLKQGQFELYYQPKIHLLSKELAGAEALIRWCHPERGLLAPGEFLPLIENTELDIEIGEWVTTTALQQMHAWHQAGLNLEVSINISGYHLESPHFVENLKEQLARYPNLPLGKLQIEVLETVALNDIAIVREIIEECRKFGVVFALDDFGTGYSSLSYLSALPVDVLKIDQSFVRDMLEDQGDRAIVQGIIALAKAFNRQTVAEGVETEGHYQALLEMGCELGQGYGIAKPMPAAELMKNWRLK